MQDAAVFHFPSQFLGNRKGIVRRFFKSPGDDATCNSVFRQKPGYKDTWSGPVAEYFENFRCHCKTISGKNNKMLSDSKNLSLNWY